MTNYGAIYDALALKAHMDIKIRKKRIMIIPLVCLARIGIHTDDIPDGIVINDTVRVRYRKYMQQMENWREDGDTTLGAIYVNRRNWRKVVDFLQEKAKQWRINHQKMI